jgi:hypothetical protein
VQTRPFPRTTIVSVLRHLVHWRINWKQGLRKVQRAHSNADSPPTRHHKATHTHAHTHAISSSHTHTHPPTFTHYLFTPATLPQIIDGVLAPLILVHRSTDNEARVKFSANSRKAALPAGWRASARKDPADRRRGSHLGGVYAHSLNSSPTARTTANKHATCTKEMHTLRNANARGVGCRLWCVCPVSWW